MAHFGPFGGQLLRYLKNFVHIVGLPLILILACLLCSSQSTSFFVPTWEQMGNAFANTWTWPRLMSDVFPSVLRLIVGIILSIVIVIVVGLLLGSCRWLRQLMEPTMEFFRAIPPTVLIQVYMLLIGIGDDMKIAVLTWCTLWPILLNSIEGVRSMDEVLSDTSHTYRIDGFARIRYLILPSAMPQIMAGIRQSLSIALILMVISEMFASSAGLGYTIIQFQRSFAIPEM